MPWIDRERIHSPTTRNISNSSPKQNKKNLNCIHNYVIVKRVINVGEKGLKMEAADVRTPPTKTKTSEQSLEAFLIFKQNF